ncbi:uncharacterized protein L201_003785 [Kwoniella dendrophila CBS 6074]|uniref:Uncharacterized protein n=1 Tax=Kwoniella dendrophila CBS 6074 TaxID=1295534 RepID=A0AAX4JTW4_9TREE
MSTKASKEKSSFDANRYMAVRHRKDSFSDSSISSKSPSSSKTSSTIISVGDGTKDRSGSIIYGQVRRRNSRSTTGTSESRSKGTGTASTTGNTDTFTVEEVIESDTESGGTQDTTSEQTTSSSSKDTTSKGVHFPEGLVDGSTRKPKRHISKVGTGNKLFEFAAGISTKR